MTISFLHFDEENKFINIFELNIFLKKLEISVCAGKMLYNHSTIYTGKAVL